MGLAAYLQTLADKYELMQATVDWCQVYASTVNAAFDPKATTVREKAGLPSDFDLTTITAEQIKNKLGDISQEDAERMETFIRTAALMRDNIQTQLDAGNLPT